MKVLFLDIDGVVNNTLTGLGENELYPIDKFCAFLVGRIVEQTKCQVVLSSSWRMHPEAIKEVEKRIIPIYDVTESFSNHRGDEVASWLAKHPKIKCHKPTSCPPLTRAMCNGHEITKYAILDDDNDFFENQPLFQTNWHDGLTEEIANDVIKHLNS